MVVKVLALEMRARQTLAAAVVVERKVLLEEPAALVSSFFPIQCRRLHPLHSPLRLKSQFQQASRQLIIWLLLAAVVVIQGLTLHPQVVVVAQAVLELQQDYQ
jgi:hypothetical protein